MIIRTTWRYQVTLIWCGEWNGGSMNGLPNQFFVEKITNKQEMISIKKNSTQSYISTIKQTTK